MLKRVFRLFQIARKLSTSGAIDTINQTYQIPVSINLFFSLISIGSKNTHSRKNNPGQNLCEALQGMGTTFIKLGQFLATRPDIIGEEMAKDYVTKSELKDDMGILMDRIDKIGEKLDKLFEVK